MTQTKVFVAESHIELEERLNAWFRQHKRANVRFLQLVANGDAAYAVLVAWEEE